AGILALMMQADPTLNVTDAYAALRSTARKDSFTGSSANLTYGDGKVDALASVKAVSGSGATPTVCTASSTTLCLSSNRFAVSVSWKAADGSQGSGNAIPITGDTGYFWFFSSSNVEMV